MKKVIKALNILILILTITVVGCQSNPHYTDYTYSEKTISGVAVKQNGTIFGSESKIIAVSANGNFAFGDVDNKGNFKVILTGEPESGKKLKSIQGNTFLKISDGVESMYLIIARQQTKVNFNVINYVASQLFINQSNTNLSAIFDAIDEPKFRS